MKTLRAADPVRLEDLELIPVEVTELSAGATGGWVTALAIKRPLAVVVRQGGRTWALDLEGGELSLPVLLRDVDGLTDLLR